MGNIMIKTKLLALGRGDWEWEVGIIGDQCPDTKERWDPCIDRG